MSSSSSHIHGLADEEKGPWFTQLIQDDPLSELRIEVMRGLKLKHIPPIEGLSTYDDLKLHLYWASSIATFDYQRIKKGVLQP